MKGVHSGCLCMRLTDVLEEHGLREYVLPTCVFMCVYMCVCIDIHIEDLGMQCSIIINLNSAAQIFAFRYKDQHL